MSRWLHRRRRDDLRPTYAQRQAALERARDRIARLQRREARRRTWIRVGLPLLTAATFVLGLALADFVAARAAAARPELFAVRRLEIEGTRRLDPLSLAHAALPGGVAAGLGPADVASRLEAQPWVARAAVARVAPDVLVARVVEYEPAAVAVAIGETPVLVDPGGVPFADAAGTGWDVLPRLVVANPPVRGRHDPLLAQGLALAAAVAAAGYRDIEIALDGDDLNALPALRVAGIPARILLGPGDPAPKLELLHALLLADPTARDAREIDLRFANQVVLRPLAPDPDAAETMPGAGAPGAATGGGTPARATGDRTGASRRSPSTRG